MFRRLALHGDHQLEMGVPVHNVHCRHRLISVIPNVDSVDANKIVHIDLLPGRCSASSRVW